MAEEQSASPTDNGQQAGQDQGQVQDQTQETNTEEQNQGQNQGGEGQAGGEGGEGSQDGGQGEVNPKSLNRFEELIGKAKEATARAEKAEQELAKTKGQSGQGKTGNKFQIDPNKEYTVQELNDMLTQAQEAGKTDASQEVQKLRQEIETKEAGREFQTTLNDDVSYLENTYPELNENSEEYNPDLHKELVGLYRELAIEEGQDGAEIVNPKVSLKKIGERFMRGAGYSAAEATDRTARTVGRQASRSERGDSTPRKKQVIDANWFANEYDPSNPEHKKIAQEYISNNQYK